MRVARVSLLAIVLLLSSAAAQAAAGKRIGVPKFEGAQEALVRKEVMQSLKSHGYEVVGSREMSDAMSSTSAGLDSDDGLKTLAKELSLSAIVTGEVGPKRAKIVVHDGGEGSILGDGSFSGANPRKLATEVGLTFWKKLGPDVGRGHVPSGAKKASASAAAEDDTGAGEAAAPKPKDDSSATEEGGAADEGAAKKKKKSKVKMEETPPAEASAPAIPSGRAWLDFDLGMGGYSRSLTFNQNLTPSLLSYTLGVGPVAVANVVMYPLDPLFGGLLGNIGLEAEIQQGFAISSTLVSNGVSHTYPDVVHDYAGGGRYRFTFGAANDFYVSVTGGEDAFTFTGRSQTNMLNIPDTIYHYVRPGAGVDLAVGGGLSFALSGGYRVVLNHAGVQFQQFFPHSTVAGADAELEARYALSDMFQVRAGLEWRRYWFAMHSQPSDASANGVAIAGGAVDQSFAFTARIAILIGSSSVPKTEGGAEEAPPPPPPNPKGRGHKSDEDSSGDSDAAPAVETSGGHKGGDDADQ
jgi:hypothetical protein